MMRGAFDTVRELMALVPQLKTNFRVRVSDRAQDPLLFVAVADSSAMPGISDLVERSFGAPYKPAGDRALWKNLTDPFVKAAGGVEQQQTLFRKVVSPTLTLYCAFWPWASDPSKTSIRLGLLCAAEDERGRANVDLAALFR